MKAHLTFCVEEEWIPTNVASAVRAPKANSKTPPRRIFEPEERATLLKTAIEIFGEASDMVWLIKLAAYTGARLEELAQLVRSNVRQSHGVWIIEINDLEGRNVKN